VHDVLSGIRVLEVASWTFVPAAGAVLADWGADVVKVEHPVSGDPQRGLITSGLIPGAAGVVNFMMEQPNRGKRSIGLDISTPGGREVLYKLVESSDVFLTNFLPDARARLQIDLEDIRAVNPQIIYVRGHGQGTRGPDAHKGGYDGASYWARGGIGASLTPADREWPISQTAAFGDLNGGMTIAGGISGALVKRERTGEPSVVDVSLLGLAMWTMSPNILASRLFDLPGGLPSFGTRPVAPNPLVGIYKTKDGRFISLVMLEADRFWADFVTHLGRGDLIDDPRFKDATVRQEHRAECLAELDAAFATKTLDEWKTVFADLAGVWAPVQNVYELYEDPQAVANGYVVHIDAGDGGDGGGTFPVIANPVQFDETPPSLRGAPEHGQHTEEILLELGLDWDAIVAHKEAGAVL
jgi:crotonobetainyl-CoA:carnitine CoA-transferase CaiB-like acyl-CoA transferase